MLGRRIVLFLLCIFLMGALTHDAYAATPTQTTNRCLVRAGDSLYWIGLRYGTTVAALKKANGLTGNAIYPGKYLTLPGVPTVTPWHRQSQATRNKPLVNTLRAKGLRSGIPNPLIVVDKSDYTLSLFSGRTWLKSYQVALSDSGSGDKQVAGDHKNPEGRFYISERLVLSPPTKYLGSRWLRLSYPTPEDAKRGLNRGLITTGTYRQIIQAAVTNSIPPQTTALGGGIGIHGGDTPALGDNWTWGCVGLTNAGANEIYPYVGVGTPVVITP